jgi:hypothetical protein
MCDKTEILTPFHLAISGSDCFHQALDWKFSLTSYRLEAVAVIILISFYMSWRDRLCGLVVRVLGYRSGGPGSIPGTTRFSEEKKRGETSSGSGMGSTQPREYN